MNKFLKRYTYKKKNTIIVIQDQFTLTKFSLCIKFHKELSIFVFLRVYFLEAICLQTLQVQWLQPQHLIMALKLFKFSEVFTW